MCSWNLLRVSGPIMIRLLHPKEWIILKSSLLLNEHVVWNSCLYTRDAKRLRVLHSRNGIFCDAETTAFWCRQPTCTTIFVFELGRWKGSVLMKALSESSSSLWLEQETPTRVVGRVEQKYGQERMVPPESTSGWFEFKWFPFIWKFHNSTLP